MAVLKVPDGRQVHYELSGPGRSGGAAIVFHHGRPGAALLWNGLVREADRFGWSVVMVSRPGYAGSERKVGRNVADVCGDIAAVLDHLGVERFVTAGWSGGGPHALACGALLSSRCRAVATIAGVAPYDGAPDLDWMAGMGEPNVAQFGALIAGDRGLEARIKTFNDALANIQGDQLIDALGGLLSDPDRKVMVGECADLIAKWMRASATSGHYGYWDDGQAFVSPWGFDVAKLAVPVTVWVGGQDLMVPPAHGRWLGDHVPGAISIELPDEGHVSLLWRHAGDILRGLADVSEL